MRRLILLVFALGCAGVPKGSLATTTTSASTFDTQHGDCVPSQSQARLGRQICVQNSADSDKPGETIAKVGEVKDVNSDSQARASNGVPVTPIYGHEDTPSSNDNSYACVTQLQNATIFKDAMTQCENNTRRFPNGELAPEEHVPMDGFHTSKHNYSDPVQDSLHNLNIRYVPFNSSRLNTTSIEVTPHTITGTLNANNAQIQDPATDWCCVVHIGVKFCFYCPSATSATEVALTPRATATMTYGKRSMLPRVEDQSEEAQKLCCFTTGFIVSGCYLCHDTPPMSGDGGQDRG